MKRLLLLIITLVGVQFAHAQLLSWSPPFPKEADASQTFEITVDVSKGNQGLLAYTPTTDVYAHIGVITSKSTSASDWKYVPFTWATTTAAANAPYTGNNKYKYTITGSLRNFFTITDPTETILYIAILFRNGDGSRVQRNTDGSDIYIPVYPANVFAVRLSLPPRAPKFVPTPEPQTWSVGTTVPVAAAASKPSAMKLYYNGTVIATSTGNVTTLSGNAAITAAGNQQFVSEATDGSATVYDTLTLFVAGTVPVAPLPAGVQDGINYNSNTSVTLVLRAPGKNGVTVIGDFNDWTQTTSAIMNKTPDGKFFWITLNGLTPGTEYGYQYVVDGTVRIADPYTEKVLDPNNDRFIPASTYPNLKAYPTGKTTGMVGVLQPGQTPYAWTATNFAPPDKKGLVIYELLLRDFLAAHDWKTLTDTLSYLKRLGINAIEVMPFNEFEGNISWGYNGFQYFAPDKYYGSKNSLKAFIDACHQNGMAVIMDIVLNHTYGPSPLKELYGLANNPWYNPVQPHAFGFGDDFNHESGDTKYFFDRVLQHWLNEYRIDGYRVDFSKGLTQKPSGNDQEFSARDAGRIAILKSYYDVVKAVDPDAYFILEHFTGNDEEKELSETGMMLWARVYTPYQEAAMGYLPNSNFNGGIYTVRTWTQPHLVTFMESHDEERIVFKNVTFGNSSNPAHNVKDTTVALKRMELNAAFLFTIPGPKMVWQFGELGYDYSITSCHPGNTIPQPYPKDDCRTDPKPIRWDYLAEPRRKSVYDTYSRLINLRFHPAYKGVFEGASTIEQNFGGAFKWIKLTTTNDTSDLLVIGNFDVVPQTGSVTFPTAGTWYDFFGNFIHTATGTAQSFTLQPGEFHVYVNRNVNGITPTPVSAVPGNGTTLAAKLYPNPVRSAFTVEVAMPQSGSVTLSLYNNTGQFLGTVYKGFLQKGERQVPLQKPVISTGAYFLKLEARGESKTIPFFLQ